MIEKLPRNVGYQTTGQDCEPSSSLLNAGTIERGWLWAATAGRAKPAEEAPREKCLGGRWRRAFVPHILRRRGSSISNAPRLIDEVATALDHRIPRIPAFNRFHGRCAEGYQYSHNECAMRPQPIPDVLRGYRYHWYKSHFLLAYLVLS